MKTKIDATLEHAILLPKFEIPALLFGPSQSGKTSFLMSLVDAQYRPEPATLRIGHDTFTWALQPETVGYGRDLMEQWRGGNLERTAGEQTCGFVAGRLGGPDVYFTIDDYDGKETMPRRHNRISQRVIDARVLFFMVDDTHLGRAAKRNATDSQSVWYPTIFNEYLRKNPGIHHPAVALIVNKIDKVFGRDSVEMDVLRKRPYLIGPHVNRRLIHLGASAERGLPATPFERLRQCVMEDPDFNVSPRLQRFVWDLLSEYRRFFEEAVLPATYRYQVFFTFCDGPAAQDGAHLFGAVDAVKWMLDGLYPSYLRQCQSKLKQSAVDQDARRDFLGTLQTQLAQGVAALDAKWKEAARKKHIPATDGDREQLLADALADVAARAAAFQTERQRLRGEYARVRPDPQHAYGLIAADLTPLAPRIRDALRKISDQIARESNPERKERGEQLREALLAARDRLAEAEGGFRTLDHME